MGGIKKFFAKLPGKTVENVTGSEALGDGVKKGVKKGSVKKGMEEAKEEALDD